MSAIAVSHLAGHMLPALRWLAFFLLTGAVSATAQPELSAYELHGPAPLRKIFPVELQFLGFAPDGFVSLQRNQICLSAAFAQTNTFVKSGAVVDGMPDDGMRRRFGVQRASALISVDPARNLYLFDLASSLLEISAEFGLADGVEISLRSGLLSWNGGVLDPVIERFHELAGMGDDGRPRFLSSARHAFLYVNGQRLQTTPSRPGGVRLLDPEAAIRIRLMRQSGTVPEIAARAALKFSTGRRALFYGSGSTDAGAQISAAWRARRHAAYMGLFAVLPGAWDALPRFDMATFYGGYLAFEYALSRATTLALQTGTQSTVFSELSGFGLAGASYEISLALKTRLSPSTLLFVALTENMFYFRSSADLGFSAGLKLSRK